ncbi:hypothetical protein C1645_784370 [Glomus cerebriforme]|uniref:F-box domain-containing protein n=1 Tax=Glomus cerebriforme TaxID=658196 RepID=A0A397SNV3_9GLOM|nr:hypothetical protein C1645_784370 [Glomus cerebriforme]
MINGKEAPLLNVIISHLSDRTKKKLYDQGINLFTNSCKRPLFNYISFCRYLCLNGLSQIIYTSNITELSKRLIVREELLKLFINNNTKLTSLSMTEQSEDPIHLILGAEQCFSELEYLCCSSTSANQYILEGLSKISKSIKKLEFRVSQPHYNYGIVKLIESQKNLNDVVGYSSTRDELVCKTLEESLIKHADTIQYLKMGWEPVTKILSHFVNLLSLEIISYYNTNWSRLETVSIPVLKMLKTQNIPSYILASLIKNTKSQLSEISVQYSIFDREDKYYKEDNNALIRSIYENCLNLKYLKLSIKNDDVLEFGKLLFKCQHLDGLIINSAYREDLDWMKIFNKLTELSPASLYKFKFIFNGDIELTTFKSFFDNWKDKSRKPILLKIFYRMTFTQNHINLFNRYMSDGIIKMFSYDPAEFFYDEFEWTFISS